MDPFLRVCVFLFTLSISIGTVYCDRRELAVTINPSNLTYHNGPVLTSGVNIYVDFYGAWNSTTVNTVETFLRSLGDQCTASKSPNLKEWWSTLAQYKDAAGKSINGNVTFQKSYNDTSYSAGTTFSINSTDDILSILTTPLSSGSFPVDENGIYIIMTSSNVTVWGNSLKTPFKFP